MTYRPLGRSGVAVSVIGFGAWGIGGVTPGQTSYGRTDDKVSLLALRRAYERGITLFDTSNTYGHGHSEELIGTAFRGMRDAVVIATKFGFSAHDVPIDFSETSIRNSLEASLRRLGTDHVDLLQLHSPERSVLEKGTAVEILSKLKSEGKTRAIGVSLRGPDDWRLVLGRGVDSIQVNLSLLDQRAVDNGLCRSAEAEGFALIARTPLSYGFLTGAIDEHTVFEPEDHRSRWSVDQRRRWANGARLFDERIARPRAAKLGVIALAFCASCPGVATVIPGMMNVGDVDENVEAASRVPLTGEEMKTVFELYRNEVFFG